MLDIPQNKVKGKKEICRIRVHKTGRWLEYSPSLSVQRGEAGVTPWLLDGNLSEPDMSLDS